MGIGDDELDATQPPARQLAQELRPDRLGLRGADLHAQHLAPSVAVDADGDDDGDRHDAPPATDLQVGGVDPQIRPVALGLAACQKGLSVRFATASHLVHELIEARDEKRLLRLQAQLARVNLLIVDELGYVPLSQTGSELLFDVFSRRYENGATIVTSNLPFQEWTTVFASERLTGALLDRITHHVHILEMNADSYRLKQSRSRRQRPSE